VIQKDRKSCRCDSVPEVVHIVQASHRDCDLVGLQLFSDNRVPLFGPTEDPLESLDKSLK